jgi:integrase
MSAHIIVGRSARSKCQKKCRITEKGHQDRLLSLTPDFAEWLLQTPQAEWTCYVFHLGSKPERLRSLKRVSRVVSEIGEMTGVVVNKKQGKFGSAHDLRRSFGTRSASKVKPATLQLLMRHSTIDTTLRYYLAQDADDAAPELWAGFDRLGVVAPPSATQREHPQCAANQSR